MTTPNGLPYWSRTASAELYGASAGKADYQTPGAINARTDVSAAQFLRLAADLAGIARVTPVAAVHWTCNDSAPAAPTILHGSCGATRSSASYAGDAAPAGLPSATRLGTGSIRIVLPSTSEDDFLVTSPVEPVIWIPTQLNAAGFITVSQVGSRTFDVSSFNPSSVALANTTCSIVFW